MTQRFRIDGAEYDAASLPKEGQALVESHDLRTEASSGIDEPTGAADEGQERVYRGLEVGDHSGPDGCRSGCAVQRRLRRGDTDAENHDR